MNILKHALFLIILISITQLHTFADTPLPGQSYQDDVKDTLRLEEVVVTGTQVSINRNNIPFTLSVVSRKEIEESGETALLPILSERVPGLFVTERGITGFGVAAGAAGAISIRGIGGSPNTQILLLIDGHPQFMGLMGHPLPDAYIASDVEKVEVIRGAASTIYGSNAMGGVINVITRKQKEEGFRTQGQVMYGSYNTQKYMLNNGYRKGKFNSFISVNHDRTDGHRPNSEFYITNGYGKLGYAFTPHLKANADISLAKFKCWNPGPSDAPLTNDWINILRGMASFSLENNFAKSSGALKFFYNWGDHKLSDGYHSDDQNYGISLYQGFHLFNGNTTTAGIDYKNYGGQAENTGLHVDEHISEVAGYLLLQQAFFTERLMVNAGVRYEHNSVYGGEWAPQAGIAYHPAANTTLKTSVSKGFRSPTIKDLYMFPPHNAELQPEQVINYEFSVIQHLFRRQMQIELTGFIAEGDNLIQVNLVNGKPINLNSGKFHNKGIEFALNYQITEKISFAGNYSYLHMDTPLLGAPEHKIFAGISYAPHKKVDIGVQLQQINGLYISIGKITEKENYTLLNAKVTYRLLPDHLELFVKGDNLTDTRYQVNYKYPMPGATVMGGVKFIL